MAIIKFYYNMMNGHLPDDFNCFKPHTSISCTRYPIRNPIMQYPFIKHEYARYDNDNTFIEHKYRLQIYFCNF